MCRLNPKKPKATSLLLGSCNKLVFLSFLGSLFWGFGQRFQGALQAPAAGALFRLKALRELRPTQDGLSRVEALRVRTSRFAAEGLGLRV